MRREDGVNVAFIIDRRWLRNGRTLGDACGPRRFLRRPSGSGHDDGDGGAPPAGAMEKRTEFTHVDRVFYCIREDVTLLLSRRTPDHFPQLNEWLSPPKPSSEHKAARIPL